MKMTGRNWSAQWRRKGVSIDLIAQSLLLMILHDNNARLLLLINFLQSRVDSELNVTIKRMIGGRRSRTIRSSSLSYLFLAHPSRTLSDFSSSSSFPQGESSSFPRSFIHSLNPSDSFSFVASGPLLVLSVLNLTITL